MTGITWARKLAFSLLALVFFFALAELGLRLVGFRYQSSLSYMRFNFPDPHVLHQVFEPDPLLLWKMRPGYDFGEGFEPLNRQGFRGPDFKKKKPEGALRVACLGDSVTFGRPGATYPDFLSALLSEKLSRPVEVMNFGVPGYSSWQGRRLLPRVLSDYRPDLVVILFGWNDHWLAQGFPDKEQIVSARIAPRVLEALRKLRLYQLLNRALAAIPRRQAKKVFRVSPEDYRENLVAMCEAARAAGAKPILVTAPSALNLGIVPDYLVELGFIEKKETLLSLHQKYNEIVRKTAAELKAPVVEADLIFLYRGARNLFDDPEKDIIHPNREGLRLLAEAVAEKAAALFPPEKKQGGSR